jgi:Cu+-exporting ATPase
MGTGTDMAIQGAGITLVEGNLSETGRARLSSAAITRNDERHLLFTFIYNAHGVPVVGGTLYPLFGVLLSLIIAAMAMSLSSITFVRNASRLGAAKM